MSDLANIDIGEGGDGVIVVRVAGELDLSNLHGIHAALLDSMPNDANGLVVDLAGVAFLDSSGVETLYRLQRSLAVRQQGFVVTVPPDAPIRRALELSGAPGEFALCASLDEAVRVLRAGPEQGAQATS